jgi:hypothetical protein
MVIALFIFSRLDFLNPKSYSVIWINKQALIVVLTRSMIYMLCVYSLRFKI